MKIQHLLYTALLFTISSSCVKEKPKMPSILDGTYTGDFVRASPTMYPAPVSVQITFSKGKFSGSCLDCHKNINAPRICNGTYVLNNQEIDFSNECLFTADFDWRLILNGKYTLRVSGNDVEIHRNYEEGLYDHYTLKRDPK